MLMGHARSSISAADGHPRGLDTADGYWLSEVSFLASLTGCVPGKA